MSPTMVALTSGQCSLMGDVTGVVVESVDLHLRTQGSTLVVDRREKVGAVSEARPNIEHGVLGSPNPMSPVSCVTAAWRRS